MGKKETLQSISEANNQLPSIESANNDLESINSANESVKKKVQTTQENVQSISGNGTSELETGNSGQQEYNYLSNPTQNNSVNPTIDYTADKALPNISGGYGGVIKPNNDIANYNEFKKLQQQNILNGGKVENQSDAIAFHLYNQKKENPDQYNYDLTKFGELNKEVELQKSADVNPDTKFGELNNGIPIYKTQEEKQKAISEAETNLQTHLAQVNSAALTLQQKVVGTKMNIALRNGNTFYSPEINQIKQINQDSQDLVPKIEDIKKKIDSFPKDANGQIITDAFNKADAQTSLEQYNNLIGHYQDLQKKKQEVSSDPKFKEWQSQYDDVTNQYANFQQEAQDYLKKYPKVEEAISKQKSEEKLTNEHFKNAPLPIQISESTTKAVARGVTDFVKGLSYIPKMFGAGDTYGGTDVFYENAAKGIDNFNDSHLSLPTDYNKSVRDYKTDENGKYILDDKGEKIPEWNLTYLPAKLAYTGTQMGLMMATAELGAGGAAGLGLSGEIGGGVGQFVGGFIQSAESTYTDAKSRGMSDSDAEHLSWVLATQQSALEFISPNVKLVKGNFAGAIDDYFKAISKGMTKKEATLASVKSVSKDVGQKIINENVQEYSQDIDERLNKMVAGEMTGVNFELTKDIGNQMIEIGILTSLTTLGLSGGTGVTRISGNKFQNEALFMAAHDPQAMATLAQKQFDKGELKHKDGTKYSQGEMTALQNKITIASEELNKIPKDLSDKKKSELLPGLLHKRLLEEEKKQTDKVFHPIIDEKIERQSEELKKQVGIQEEESKTENKGETKEEIPVRKLLTEDEAAHLNYLTSQKEEGIPFTQKEQKQFDDLKNKSDENITERQVVGTTTEQSNPVTETEQGGNTNNAQSTTESSKAEITPENLSEKNSTFDIAKTNENGQQETSAINKGTGNAINPLDSEKNAGSENKRIPSGTPRVRRTGEIRTERALKNEPQNAHENVTPDSEENFKLPGEEQAAREKTLKKSKDLREKLKKKFGSNLPPGTHIAGALTNEGLIDLVFDLVDRAINAGFTIKEATEKGLKLIRKHPDYKNLLKENKISEQDFEKEITSGLSETKPKKKITKKKKDEKDRTIGEEKEKSLLNRLYKAKDISSETKTKIEKYGLTYREYSQEEADNISKQIIKTEGVEGALNIARKDGDVSGDVKTLIYANAIEEYARREKEAKTKEDKEHNGMMQGIIADELDQKLRDMGRSVSAIYHTIKFSKLGIEMKEKRGIQKQNQQKIDRARLETKVRNPILKEFEQIDQEAKVKNKITHKEVVRRKKIDSEIDNLLGSLKKSYEETKHTC